MHPLDIVSYIKHNTRTEIKYNREAYRQKRGIDKKQPDFGYRDIQPLAQISTYPEGVPFKKC
jgi:hypothetical protein